MNQDSRTVGGGYLLIVDGGWFTSLTHNLDSVIKMLTEDYNAELSVTNIGADDHGYAKLSDCIVFEVEQDYVMFKLKYGVSSNRITTERLRKLAEGLKRD